MKNEDKNNLYLWKYNYLEEKKITLLYSSMIHHLYTKQYHTKNSVYFVQIQFNGHLYFSITTKVDTFKKNLMYKNYVN